MLSICANMLIWKKMCKRSCCRILVQIFDLSKDKVCYHVLVFRRGVSNAICDLVLYLLYGLNKSLIYDGAISFLYSKTIVAMQGSTFRHWEPLHVSKIGCTYVKARGSSKHRRVHLFSVLDFY